MNPETPDDRPAADPPPPGEPARSLRLSVWEGCCSGVQGALVGGIVITAYALMLHASDFHFGVLSALTTLATFGTLIGARLVGRLGGRRRLVVRVAVVSRLLFAGLCVLPFLPVGPLAHIALFLALIFATAFGAQMAQNAWLSWMTDLVPADFRGRYWSRRGTIIGAVGMFAGLGVGVGFDAMERWGARAGHDPATVFHPFVALSLVFGLAGAWLYHRQWEPPLHGESPLPFREMLQRPLANPDFRRLLWFSLLWGLLCYVASPFFMPHMMKNLHMSKSAISCYGVFAGVATLLTQLWWGRIIDQFGNRPVLVFNIVGVFILPILWLAATPDFLWPIWIDAVLTGIFWPGLNLALFNLVLGTAPRENRTSYLAVQAMVFGGAQFVAALIGGTLAHALAGFRLVLWGQTLINFHVLFLLAGLGRLLLVPLALRLRDERAQPVGVMIGFTTDKFLQIINTGIESGAAVVRRLARRPGE